MLKFEDLKFRTTLVGQQAIVSFPNGYGASVIIGSRTHGGTQGLYELAVLRDGYICYDTPLTKDVLGHLTPGDVTKYLGMIEELPNVEE